MPTRPAMSSVLTLASSTGLLALFPVHRRLRRAYPGILPAPRVLGKKPGVSPDPRVRGAESLLAPALRFAGTKVHLMPQDRLIRIVPSLFFPEEGPRRFESGIPPADRVGDVVA